MLNPDCMQAVSADTSCRSVSTSLTETRHDTHLDLILAVAFVVAGGMAAVVLVFDLFSFPCLFHELTGIPCLACGGTRAARALIAGEVFDAIAFNPLAVVAMTAVVGFVIHAFLRRFTGWPSVLAFGWIWHTRWFRPALLAAALLNWAYLVVVGV